MLSYPAPGQTTFLGGEFRDDNDATEPMKRLRDTVNKDLQGFHLSEMKTFAVGLIMLLSTLFIHSAHVMCSCINTLQCDHTGRFLPSLCLGVVICGGRLPSTCQGVITV